MSKIAPGKLVPNEEYQINGTPVTFVGTKWEGSNNVDAVQAKFASAQFGDRWAFVDQEGKEHLFRKGYNALGMSGLIPSDAKPTDPNDLIKITQ
jgi:hypothetical protein